MQAGKLDRVTEIQHPTTVLDENRTPVTTWTTVATMRAAVLQYDTSNREGQRGDTTDTVITFRMYWWAGVTLEHRILYDGNPFKITKIKELGRRAGLDIICERVGP